MPTCGALANEDILVPYCSATVNDRSVLAKLNRRVFYVPILLMIIELIELAIYSETFAFVLH